MLLNLARCRYYKMMSDNDAPFSSKTSVKVSGCSSWKKLEVGIMLVSGTPELDSLNPQVYQIVAPNYKKIYPLLAKCITLFVISKVLKTTYLRQSPLHFGIFKTCVYINESVHYLNTYVRII